MNSKLTFAAIAVLGVTLPGLAGEPQSRQWRKTAESHLPLLFTDEPGATAPAQAEPIPVHAAPARARSVQWTSHRPIATFPKPLPPEIASPPSAVIVAPPAPGAAPQPPADEYDNPPPPPGGMPVPVVEPGIVETLDGSFTGDVPPVTPGVCCDGGAGCGHGCCHDDCCCCDDWCRKWCLLHWKRSTGDMPQHFPYRPVNHGYYYFRPYNYSHIHIAKMIAVQHQGEPFAPYETPVFDKVYKELKLPEPAPPKPAPKLSTELPSLEDLLKK